MKIVVLATHFVKGGAERQLGMIAGALAKLGHEVTHVSIAEQALPEIDGVCELRARSLGIRHFRSLSFFRKTFACLNEADPAVLITCVTPCDFVGMLWSIKTGRPWVMREASSYAKGVRKDDLKLRRLLGRRASLVVANNEEGYRHWSGIRKRRPTEWIPNLMELDQIRWMADASPEIALPEGPFIVAVGRLEAVKNFAQVIRAFARLPPKYEAARLVFLGDGSLRRELEELAASLGVASRVIFVGFVANPLPVVRASSGLVLSSFYEGCPNAALEAYVLGVPVLLSDVSAHRAIFREGDAGYFPVGDEEATARVLAQCFSGNLDCDFRQELIDTWSAETNGRRLDQLLTDLQ